MNLINIFKCAVRHLSTAILMLAVFAIFSLSAFAQTVKRVVFIIGKANVVYSDSAKPGESDTYIIKLKRGQSCQVEIEWKGEDMDDEDQGLSGFTIVFPNGKRLVDAQDGYIQAKVTGDFKIIVSPKTEKTNYRYRIIFTQI